MNRGPQLADSYYRDDIPKTAGDKCSLRSSSKKAFSEKKAKSARRRWLAVVRSFALVPVKSVGGDVGADDQAELLGNLHLEPALIAVQDPRVEIHLKFRVNGLAGGIDHEDVLLPGPRMHGNSAVEVMVAELEQAGRIRGSVQDIRDVGNCCCVGKERAAFFAVVAHLHQSGGEVVMGAYGVHCEVLTAAAKVASRSLHGSWAGEGEVFWLSRHDEPLRVRESGYLWAQVLISPPRAYGRRGSVASATDSPIRACQANTKHAYCIGVP